MQFLLKISKTLASNTITSVVTGVDGGLKHSGSALPAKKRKLPAKKSKLPAKKRKLPATKRKLPAT